MITIDLKSLVNKLNDGCRTALEGAAGLCLARTHFNIEIEHWILKLLELPDSDIEALIKKYDLNPGRLIAELNSELDKIKTGNTRAPALSPNIVDLTKNAWMLASVEFGHNQATSAHVLAALLLDEGLRRSTEISSGELKKIAAESLRSVLPSIIGSTSESTSAGIGDTSASSTPTDARPTNTPSLDKFTINLTEDAKNGKIDPVL